MTAEPISVLDLAAQVGKRKQTIFKVLARLKIQTTKQRSSRGRGQLVAYVTAEEAKLVLAELQASNDVAVDRGRFGKTSALDAELGVFYLIALEPKHDPGRFKVGFAVGLAERIRHLRCSAPLLEVVGTWKCKRLWEKTAIDSITVGCERLHTEVFRTSSIAGVAERCEKFFALMPSILANRLDSA